MSIKNYSLGQSGASLIEVLVAILILSFGMLSLGAMLSFSVQLPKLSGYRAAATNLASSTVERIRANPEGFSSGLYATPLKETSGWSFAEIPWLSELECLYPTCTSATLATMDIQASRIAIRRELPGGDLIIKCSPSPCAKTSYGEIWTVWQEPSTFAALNSSSSDKSDNCPTEATTLYTNPRPRCLYVQFKIE
jgi:type IV pilus assembly protein PilV